jgi:hypothetical protein
MLIGHLPDQIHVARVLLVPTNMSTHVLIVSMKFLSLDRFDGINGQKLYGRLAAMPCLVSARGVQD